MYFSCRRRQSLKKDRHWKLPCRINLVAACWRLQTRIASLQNRHKICRRISQSQNRVLKPFNVKLEIKDFIYRSGASTRLTLILRPPNNHYTSKIRSGCIAPATKRRVRARRKPEVDWMIEQPLLDHQHCRASSSS
jgi:hypothetical protein